MCDLERDLWKPGFDLQRPCTPCWIPKTIVLTRNPDGTSHQHQMSTSRLTVLERNWYTVLFKPSLNYYHSKFQNIVCLIIAGTWIRNHPITGQDWNDVQRRLMYFFLSLAQIRWEVEGIQLLQGIHRRLEALQRVGAACQSIFRNESESRGEWPSGGFTCQGFTGLDPELGYWFGGSETQGVFTSPWWRYFTCRIY